MELYALHQIAARLRLKAGQLRVNQLRIGFKVFLGDGGDQLFSQSDDLLLASFSDRHTITRCISCDHELTL
jgi:hypothetical protein